jgi:N6-L-threonylcarbamoyladenine synthase
MRVLGIETSCDETAAAILDGDGGVRSSVVASQADLHRRYGGVVPELASRRHLERLLPVIDLALEEAACGWEAVDAFAVTCGPGLVGALAVGVAAGKALAFCRDVPIVGVNHLEGHLFAVTLEHGPLPAPALALIVSGAHTDLVLVQGPHRYVVLGRTRDDAAGEAFDKVARAMGFGYPGGPLLDRLGQQGDSAAVPLPVPMADRRHPGYDFSFSGIKTAALRAMGPGPDWEPAFLADVAASLQRVVAEALVRTVARAAVEYPPRALLLVGGVAANSVLRRRLGEEAARLGLPVLIPSPRWCTDNAAMIAAAGRSRLARGERAGGDLSVAADLPL